MNTALGETGVTIFGIFFGLQSFVFMPVFGLNNATVPLVAFNFGARHKERIVRAIELTCLYAVGIMLAGMAVFQIFPDKLLLLFNATDRLLTLGVPALRIVSLGFPLAALGIVFSSVFQALGRGWESLVSVIFRQILVLLPAVWLLARLADINAVWWAFPLADALALFLGLYLFRRIYQKQIKPL